MYDRAKLKVSQTKFHSKEIYNNDSSHLWAF